MLLIKKIVFGGNQLRPNIHIKDMINAYLKVIEADKKLIWTNLQCWV